jgi:hypothetical protein
MFRIPVKNNADSVKNSAEKIDQYRKFIEGHLIRGINHELNKMLRKRVNRSPIEYFVNNNAFLSDLVAQFVEKIGDIQALEEEKEKTARQYVKNALSALPFFIEAILKCLDNNPEQFDKMDQEFLNQLVQIECLSSEAEVCYAQMERMIQDTEIASKPVDRREHATDERLQRRFDSFSRLLSLKPSVSICSSVAIVDDELIIGLNSTGNATPEAMAGFIINKLSIIREFIRGLSDESIEITIDERVEAALNAIIQAGGTTQSRDSLRQALIKLTDATSVDGCTMRAASTNYFSAQERDAILVSPDVTVLLPVGKRRSSETGVANAMTILRASHTGAMLREDEHLGVFASNVMINHFHAEQLIVLYLKNKKLIDLNTESEPRIRLGISKLCCATCRDVIQRHPRLQVRGTHHLSYEHVADVFSGMACRPGTPDRVKKIPSPTEAVASPFFSPGAMASPAVECRREGISILKRARGSEEQGMHMPTVLFGEDDFFEPVASSEEDPMASSSQLKKLKGTEGDETMPDDASNSSVSYMSMFKRVDEGETNQGTVSAASSVVYKK